MLFQLFGNLFILPAVQVNKNLKGGIGMIRRGTKNGVDYAIREGYVGGARVKELHFQRRYGTQKQFAVYLGAVRFPYFSRKKEEKLVNDMTKILKEIWGLD